MYRMSADGRFPVQFVNDTRGAWSSAQIHVYGLGLDAAGRWCRLRADGAMLPIDPADANAPGHLTKRGVNYAAYAFPISEATAFRMPAHITAGRFYISVGAPMHIALGDDAWAAPDPLNPSDPNVDTVYDRYDFDWAFGRVAFSGNTTQVESFGLPYTVRLKRASTGDDRPAGIALGRNAVFGAYERAVGVPFRSLAGPARIIAPFRGTFRPGQPGQDYLQPAIDEAWRRYSVSPFQLQLPGELFTGGVVDGRLRFFRNAEGPYTIARPSTYDVMAGANALASGNDAQRRLGAQLCAAFNRGVADDTSKWLAASAYYPADGLKNDYAMFFHAIGLDRRACGFAGDDVNDQGSVQRLPDADDPPTSLALHIGW